LNFLQVHPPFLPGDLVAVLDSCFQVAGNKLDPVRKFFEHFESLGEDCLRESQGKKGIVGYGQAMGNPKFSEILSISEGDVLGLDHLIVQYKAGVIPFQVMHRSQLDPKLISEDQVYFEKVMASLTLSVTSRGKNPPDKWTLQQQLCSEICCGQTQNSCSLAHYIIGTISN
jgi:hypothetical protein